MLTTVEARVLGCLIEKQATTPDVYPLTLKALVTACNQSTNRDPVMTLSAHLVESAALALKAIGYVRVVHPGSGERATRYRHVADEVLGVDEDGLALVALLMLRGPQTVAELRARSERLAAFGSTGAVEEVLAALEGHEPALVQRVARRAGERETRWMQLVAEEATPSEPAAPGADEHPEPAPAAPPRVDRVAALEARVADLEARLAHLEESLGG